ncbi:MAG: 2-C-methyl-D-erythritol 4-phosphate cytidylyltransferase [Ignavibacteria bacterium]|nr:2-C-methyl-D-erythritol 4-phosphate cytidylyltransferase [Ignavibacteria bacterium]
MQNAKGNVGVVIPAAGNGKRMRSAVPKQLLLLEQKPILVHTLEKFERCEHINDIILVVSKETLRESERLVKTYAAQKVKNIILGGKERQHSVALGCNALRDFFPEIIVVHDAVRPLFPVQLLETLIANARKFGAVVPVVVPKDTLGLVSSENTMERFLSRETLRFVQTPQVFRSEILWKAIATAEAEHFLGTDESSLVHNAGFSVKCIEGSPFNIKITTEEDLNIATLFLKFLSRNADNK